MKITFGELISYIREKAPRLRLYDTYMVICLIDKELVGRRAFSLTGLEWTYKDGQLYWKNEEYITDLEINREAQEVIDQTVESVKDLDDRQLRNLVNMEF